MHHDARSTLSFWPDSVRRGRKRPDEAETDAYQSVDAVMGRRGPWADPAVGALAVGALAVGALAVGALAVGRRRGSRGSRLGACALGRSSPPREAAGLRADSQ